MKVKKKPFISAIIIGCVVGLLVDVLMFIFAPMPLLSIKEPVG